MRFIIHHANLTKQQQIDLVDIDLKHLRWVSEIVADGSEIRSLAGRSCRLGDGTSRNPADRDALMAQRTKDSKMTEAEAKVVHFETIQKDVWSLSEMH